MTWSIFKKHYKELNYSDYLNLNTKQIIVKYFLIEIMKYVHIGLGKNGTSFLQNEVFPKISNLLNIKYYNKDINHDFLSLDNYFVSFEDLVGEFFSPTTWEESLKINIEKFGRDANIIITIRNPIDYFTSMFCQSYHSFQIGPEEEFFLDNVSSKKNLENKKYYFINYENFSYERLINLYTKEFKNVYIIKYEDNKNLEIWSKVFKNENINKLNINNKLKNRSYSHYGMTLTFKLNKFLKIFNSNLYNFQMSINKISEFKLFPKKIRDKLRYELNWRFFIQYRFDKFFSYKKYKIQNSSIKKHIIQNNEGFYKKLNSFHYFNNVPKEIKTNSVS